MRLLVNILDLNHYRGCFFKSPGSRGSQYSLFCDHLLFFKTEMARILSCNSDTLFLHLYKNDCDYIWPTEIFHKDFCILRSVDYLLMLIWNITFPFLCVLKCLYEAKFTTQTFPRVEAVGCWWCDSA